MGGPQAISYAEWIQIAEINDLTIDDFEKLLLLEETMIPIIRQRMKEEFEQKEG